MINVFQDDHKWEVWSDTEVSEKDGRCLAVGDSELDALDHAFCELNAEMGQVMNLRRQAFEKGESK